MYTIFAILIVITCILLVLVVLVQNPKGGGLSATFGGGNQVMGVKKTADFLEKATWYLAIALLVLSLLSNFAIERAEDGSVSNSAIQEQLDETPIPAQSLPALPVAEPTEAPAAE
jgi:preprotein translocase subunit SecG